MFVMYVSNLVGDTHTHTHTYASLIHREKKYDRRYVNIINENLSSLCFLQPSTILNICIHNSYARDSGSQVDVGKHVSTVEKLRLFIYDWWIFALSSHCLYSLHSHSAPNTNMPEPIWQFVIFKISQPLNLGSQAGTQTPTSEPFFISFISLYPLEQRRGHTSTTVTHTHTQPKRRAVRTFVNLAPHIDQVILCNEMSNKCPYSIAHCKDRQTISIVLYSYILYIKESTFQIQIRFDAHNALHLRMNCADAN